MGLILTTTCAIIQSDLSSKPNSLIAGYKETCQSNKTDRTQNKCARADRKSKLQPHHNPAKRRSRQNRRTPSKTLEIPLSKHRNHLDHRDQSRIETDHLEQITNQKGNQQKQKTKCTIAKKIVIKLNIIIFFSPLLLFLTHFRIWQF